MASKHLVTWIGNTDVRLLPPQGKGAGAPENSGPIDTLLYASGPYRHVHCCFTDAFADRIDDFFDCMKKRHTNVCFTAHPVGNLDPVDYQAVYDAVTSVLMKIRTDNTSVTLTFNLTSGTPAMSAVLLYIGKNMAPDVTLLATRSAADARGSALVMPVSWPFGAAMREQEAPAESTYALPGSQLKTLRRLSLDPDVSILLLGESGSGKSHLAHTIHQWSGRPGAWTEVNCAEFSDDPNMAHSSIFGYVAGAFTGAAKNTPGKFELADGGTFFLDEIGDLPLRIQGMLLLALDSKQFIPLGGHKKKTSDVRMICATNRDLISEVNSGRFREDLYYRLADYSVELTPFRMLSEQERRELVLGALHDMQSKRGQVWLLNDDALAALIAYPWPGNIRQMRHTLKRLCLLSDGRKIHANLVRVELAAMRVPNPAGQHGIAGGHTPSGVIPSGFSLTTVLEEHRQHYVRAALDQTRTKTAAAKLLGIDLQSIRRYMAKWNW